MIEEIRKIFLSEALGHLKIVESVTRGERIVGEESEVEAVYRAMHTMKGSAPMFGYEHLTDITLAVEQAYKRLITDHNETIPVQILAKTEQAASIIRICLSSLDLPKDEVMKEKKDLVDYFNQLQ